MPIAFITGASSGFGAATARKFAAHGYDLIVTARRAEKLDELVSSIKKVHPVKMLPLVFDVRDRQAATNAINTLPETWRQIDILVNNAGLASGRDPFDQANTDDWETMIDTNIKGLLYVTKAVLPGMISRKKGHIINLGSISGNEVYKDGNVYCATKFAVDALSQAMRIDLLPHSIKVTNIKPGAAETEFSYVRFKGDTTQAKATYAGYEPLQAEDVAGVIFFAASLPPHVCINDLTMTATAQANSHYLFRSDI